MVHLITLKSRLRGVGKSKLSKPNAEKVYINQKVKANHCHQDWIVAQRAVAFLASIHKLFGTHTLCRLVLSDNQ